MSNIEVCLCTRDNKLRKLCSDIFGQFISHNSTITICDNHQSPPKADLYIWDFEADAALPDNVEWLYGTKLFVVHRMDLPHLRKRCPQPKLGVLLKPVTRSTLAAFIEHFTESRPNPGRLRVDRDYLLQALIEANLKLQEFDQDRSNFIAGVVHDFRSPLTAASGYCGLLLADALKPLQPGQKEIITRVKSSVDRLFVLADAMLEFGTHTRVDRSARLQPGDLQSVVDQVLDELGPALTEKHITVEVLLSPCPELTHFDTKQMERVVFNILGNACKYSSRNGSVKIDSYPYFWERRSRAVTVGYGRDRRRLASQAPNAFRVDVHDSGPGIPKELCQNLFDEYKTYSGLTDRAGTGLGLAMCKQIMNCHNGRIWVRSDGAGAVFSFALPFSGARDSQILAAAETAAAR